MPRSVSFDVLALDKASSTLSEVAREVTKLDEKISAAGGEIEVDADTAKAQEKLRAVDSQLARLNAKSFKVDADTQAAERQLQVLRAELERTTDDDRQVKIRADISQVQAQLRRLEAEKVSIDVDTGAAHAKVLALRASIDGIDKHTSAKVDVDAAGSLSKLAQLGTQLRAIQTPVTIAVSVVGGVQVLSWIQSVAAGLTSIGALGAVSIGVVGASFSGIGDALSAMGEKAKSGGGAVADASAQIRSATQGVKDAERDLADAQDDERAAQEALTDARKDAARTLRDLALDTEEMGLRQKDAALSVREAQARLDEVNKDSKSTAEERERAELRLEEALFRQKKTAVEATDLSEKKNEADKRGVEGSTQVVDAQNRIKDAHENTVRATERLAEAQQQLADAMKPKGGGGTQVDKLAEAMAKLTPEGREFVRFLRDLIDGPLKELQDTAQSNFLPGLQSGIQGFMDNLDGANESIATVAQNLGQFFEDIGPHAGAAADALLRLAAAGSDEGLSSLADLVNNLLDSFTAWANSTSSDDIVADFHEIGSTITSLKDDAVAAFRAIQLAWETITFPTEVFRNPIKAFVDLYEAFRKFVDQIPGMSGRLPEVSDGLKRIADASTESAAKTDQHRQSLILTGQQMGLTRDEATRYANAITGLPSSKDTKISADTTAAQAALKATKSAVDDIKDKSQKTTATTSGATGPLQALKSLIDTIRDKSVTITSIFRSIYQTITGASEGGWVGMNNPGATPGRDSVPMMLMPDEYVIKSSQAKKYGPLLEAINSDRLASAGGALAGIPVQGGGGLPLGYGGAGGAPTFVIQVTATNNMVGSNDELARGIATAVQEGIHRGYLPRALLAGES